MVSGTLWNATEKLFSAMESLLKTFHCTGIFIPLINANLHVNTCYYRTEKILMPGHAILKYKRLINLENSAQSFPPYLSSGGPKITSFSIQSMRYHHNMRKMLKRNEISCNLGTCTISMKLQETLRRDDILCGCSSRQSTARTRCCFKRSDAMISFVAPSRLITLTMLLQDI